MTVSAQTPIDRSTGNGVTTVFPYGFKILAEEDLLVTVDGVEQELGVDYTVTGVGDDNGGDVTFISGAPADLSSVIRQRAMALVRETDYQDQGEMPAETVDVDFDRAILMIQQIDEKAGRALTLPPGVTGVSADLPEPVAGALIGWNGAGDGLQNYVGTTDVPVTAFAATLLDDATAADARSTLSAAKSGANSDITSFSGLTTALSIPQGGTGGQNANQARANLLQLPPVRQTVLHGPVDSGGLPNFGGSTGTGTVTASGTLVATTANGVSGDRIGSITNPSWTGLTTNGTMYLYLDIAENGTCTPGSTTLEPTYRWGGADVTTNGQATFNKQEMVMKVGNGSAAVQTHRVFVGEVTVAGSVVTAITWYALMGRYDSGYTNTLPASATQVSRNHNLGVVPEKAQVLFRNITPELNYSAGDVITNPWVTFATAGQFAGVQTILQRMAVAFRTPGSGWLAVDKTTGTGAAALAAANWAYKVTADRGW